LSNGLATLDSLFVPNNSQLGNADSDITNIFGTVNIKNEETSGSIICDTIGNLILDGSNTSGIFITDGILYLGNDTNL